ncbi:MAG: hypothetical protein Q9160_005510 [Pyrenula sp. 1 TL-2023]
MLRKLRWLILGFLAPEFVLLVAAGQWSSARHSMKDMQNLGHTHWTMVHGFYADSGGYWLNFRDFPRFPATAKQIHYLVHHQYLKMPQTTEEDIKDKSKADIIAKTIACLQTLWFVLQCIARSASSLPIAPIELCTCCIILCTATTYFFWLKKPLNVGIPITLTIDSDVSTVLIAAGQHAQKQFRYTPLDFVDSRAFILPQWERAAQFYGVYKHPLTRIPNDRNPYLYNLKQRLLIGGVTLVFSTISFADWHFEFPTRIEQLVWRAGCLMCESTLFIHAIAENVAHRDQRGFFYISKYKTKWPQLLILVIPGGIYFLARTMLVLIAFSSLRFLPLGCYIDLNWLDILPHI